MPKESTAVKQSWLDRSALPNFKISWETLLLAILLVAAVVTRFYILGERTMSHDETTHVLYSWELQQGNGYAHDPLSHGPFQFHILALTYFLFGDNDFTARAPHALFSVMTVLFVWWAFRRYIGRVGAIVAAFFFLISPYMLYYGRYARNESFVALFGLVVIWAVLRFLDRGDYKYLWVMTAATALHFASKETAFIYTAQMLLFLGLVFLVRIGSHKWRDANSRSIFFGVLILTAALLLLAIAGHTVLDTGPGSVSGTEVLEPVDAAAGTAAAVGAGTHPVVLILGGLGVLTLVGSLVVLARGYGWDRLKAERSFAVMLLMFALVLPHLAAFPLKLIRPDLTFSYFRSVFIGFNFGSFFSSPDLGNVLLLIVSVFVFFAISAVLGWLWNPRQWLINMAIFFAIFLPLFTTMFTNSLGLFTGLVGSLGYWIEQQAVQRGSQPQYYYVVVQIPIYEFLALAGTLLAAWIGARLWWKERDGATETHGENENLRPAASRRLALWMLAFWTVSSAAAYTIAGEKMPWLTVHIALPMLLLSGWAISWVLKRVDWPAMAGARGLWITGATILAVLSALGLLGMLLGLDTPFRGLEQDSLQDTLRFVFTAILLAASIWVLLRYRGENWPRYQTRHAFILVIFAGLAFLTARAAFRANYINYDLATEYLVYAHMARGPKEMMEQLEELSLRTTDGLGIRVAYDNETNYPLWWYLRNYPNKVYYDVNPSAGLRDMPVIIVGDANYGKIEPIVRDDYYVQEFVRIWWPNQDYFDFTPQSVGFAFTSETGLDASQMGAVDYWGRAIARILAYVDTPEERNATLDIWLNRDFTDYLSIKGQDTSLAKWNPSRTMRMYIRKDIAAQIWDYGVAPVAIEPDPYEGLGRQVAADLIVGFAGTNLGEFNAPRGLAAAPDGSVYVADSFNHRIQHLAADGSVINAWGTPSDPNAIEKAPASFNEPWGVAVSPDGRFVYVADTWNHRVQKFTAAGEFVTGWGIFGNVSDEVSLYGPRDVAVTEDDHVLVTDTGNKRIVVYDANGVFVSQVGGSGIDLGKFEEPVGLAYDLENSLLYVADTWNQRIQVLSYADGMLTPQDAWEIEAWFGQSLNNKPYLTVGEDGKVYVSDPETARILVFNSDGTLEYFFGGYDQTAVQIGLAQGISSDGNGGLWLSDSQNQYILHFTLP
jgi:predicted membrane-bound mannosyltransferase/sugar lactone lactonase YvrE